MVKKKYLLGAAVLIAVGMAWGYWKHQKEDQVLLRTLGMERANLILFASIHNDLLINPLTVLPVTTDPAYKKEQLTALWRESAVAREWRLSGIVDYDPSWVYTQIENLAGRLLMKPLDQPWTEEEKAEMKLALQYVRTINEEMMPIYQMKRTDEEWASITQDADFRRHFQQMSAKISTLPKLAVEPPPPLGYQVPDEKFRGELLSEEQQAQAAKAFVEPEIAEKYDFVKTGGNSGPGVYYNYSPVEKDTRQGTLNLTVGVAENGGHIVRYERQEWPKPAGKQITMEEAEQIALTSLQKWNPELNMKRVSAWEAEGQGDFTFVPLREGALVETEQVQVSVSLPHGKLSRLDASRFFANNDPARPRFQAKLTNEGAKAKVIVPVDGGDLVIVRSRTGPEVLAYKYTTVDKPPMAIYINAVTGAEELIQITER